MPHLDQTPFVPYFQHGGTHQLATVFCQHLQVGIYVSLEDLGLLHLQASRLPAVWQMVTVANLQSLAECSSQLHA